MNRSPSQVYPGKRSTGLLLTALALAAAGCAPVFLAAGAVAGYAVSRDSVTVDFDRPWENVWISCLNELRYQGRVKRENRATGRIEARVRESDVSVTLEQLTPATVRVVIRSRKHLLPNVEVAQRVSIGIARRVG